MIVACVICFILIIIACVLGLPEKWNNAEKVKKFHPHCVTVGLADIYFQDFVDANARHGIKINLVKIESSTYGVVYYYTEEKLNATK